MGKITNLKHFTCILLLCGILISSCSTQSTYSGGSDSYSPPARSSYGPFTTYCAHPLLFNPSGSVNQATEVFCKSTSECSNSAVGLSGCEHFCTNKKGYNSAVGSKGFEQNGKIMCECICQ